tara:strand:+ start:967 stop:1527 length:561 start_codon:yes stop_codon:yes gene_type:complete
LPFIFHPLEGLVLRVDGGEIIDDPFSNEKMFRAFCRVELNSRTLTKYVSTSKGRVPKKYSYHDLYRKNLKGKKFLTKKELEQMVCKCMADVYLRRELFLYAEDFFLAGRGVNRLYRIFKAREKNYIESLKNLLPKLKSNTSKDLNKYWSNTEKVRKQNRIRVSEYFDEKQSCLDLPYKEKSLKDSF